MTDDCRIPEGVLHAVYQTRRAIEAHRQATAPAPTPDPECPECHGTGVVESFTHVYPCGRGCSR